MRLVKTIILAMSVAVGGCSALDFKPLRTEDLKNANGHVIGYVEKGEEADRVVLFAPKLGESGRVVAYEERTKAGVVIRDVHGKRIGARYVDLRSRGSNAGNSGLTIVFMPRDAERLAEAQTVPVTIEEVKQHLKIAN
jgi:hypothetical protein